MDMCRLCLSTEKQMLNLDDNFITNYNILTSLNINSFDGMPQVTCPTCFGTVKYFIDFREKCIASETTLRDAMNPEILKEDIKTENDLQSMLPENKKLDINIKTEIKEEYDDTNFPDDFNSDCYLDDLKTMIIEKEHNDRKPNRMRRKLNKRKRKKRVIKTEKPFKNEKILPITKNLVCGICPNEFQDSNELNCHLEFHKSEQKCNLCGDTCSSWPELLSHRLMHVPQGQHKCHLCGKRYKSPLYFEYHLRNLHIDVKNKNLKCKLCNLSFEKPKRLVCHIQEIHSPAKYFCDMCTRSFNNKSNLISHMKKHSEKKAYVCDLCGFSSKRSAGLQEHTIRRHTATKTYCKNCGRAFLSQKENDKHKCKKRHRAICPICGKEFPGTNGLSRHLNSHSEEHKYKCNRCPAKYKTRGALIAHIDRHDNNRTKQCEYCNAKFFTTSVLIKHRRVHTGEKPYVCKICNKGFTSNHNLKVHMKVHGEYLIVKKNNEQDDLTEVIN